MECFLVALAVALVLAILAAPIFALVALQRSRKLEARVAELDLDVSRLLREVEELRESAGGPGEAPRTEVRQREEAAFTAEVAESEAPPPPSAPPVPPVPPAPPVPATPEAPPPVATPPPPMPPEPPRPSAADLVGPKHPPPTEPDRPAWQPPPPSSEPSGPSFDWEQWIGVKGAAVLGGILFALAGLYFVRFAIEEGWLAPPVRVALGILAGLAAVVGSEVLLRRGYEPTANAVAGGGVVVLYASVWAAHSLYQLFPAPLAFALMALVTVAAGVIAWRHRTQVVAVLGLVGGFATPLLLETEPDRPLSLFGYLLLLNLALVFLARRRGWPLLAPLGLLATLGYEALWIHGGMAARELLLALAILAVFAALFAVAAVRARHDALTGPEEEEESSEAWDWTRFGALAAPFAFALYLALRADLGPHLWPTAALMLILAVAGEALDRGWGRGPGASVRDPARLEVAHTLGPVAAGASVAVVAAWTLRLGADSLLALPALAWELVAICVALAGAFHVFAEIDLRRRRDETSAGALVTAGGFLALLAVVSVAADGASFTAPWIVGWTVLAGLLVRQGWLSGVRWRPVVAAAVIGLVYPLFHLAHADEGLRPSPPIFFALLVASGIVLQGVALAGRRREGTRRWPDLSALALPVAALAGLFGQALVAGLSVSTAPPPAALDSGLYLGLTLALAFLAVLAATRMRNGWVYLGTLVLLAWDHLAWAFEAEGEIVGELVPVVAAVLLFTAWPFLAGRSFHDRPAAWWAAALAGPAWFLPLLAIWTERWGDDAVGLLPVLLGALSLAAAFRARALWGAGDPGRLRALAWFGAVALGFAALAVPLQLEREWITVAWALEGVAVLALWRRLDHPGLKYFGLALLGAVTVRLVVNPEVLGYHPRTGLPIWNWLAYTYLVPAAALVGGSLLLAGAEVERARPAERSLYRAGRPVGSMAAGAAAIAVVFVWINLAVFDLFGTGGQVTLDVARTMARDLTLSLAWAVYALVLLALGFARQSRGLRGVGLGLLTLTVVKVFLYDLSGLEDLYRVASLAGLAVSLVLVSLAYQRFVLRKAAPQPPRTDGEPP